MDGDTYLFQCVMDVPAVNVADDQASLLVKDQCCRLLQGHSYARPEDVVHGYCV